MNGRIGGGEKDELSRLQDHNDSSGVWGKGFGFNISDEWMNKILNGLSCNSAGKDQLLASASWMQDKRLL